MESNDDRQTLRVLEDFILRADEMTLRHITEFIEARKRQLDIPIDDPASHQLRSWKGRTW